MWQDGDMPEVADRSLLVTRSIQGRTSAPGSGRKGTCMETVKVEAAVENGRRLLSEEVCREYCHRHGSMGKDG